MKVSSVSETNNDKQRFKNSRNINNMQEEKLYKSNVSQCTTSIAISSRLQMLKNSRKKNKKHTTSSDQQTNQSQYKAKKQLCLKLYHGIKQLEQPEPDACRGDEVFQYVEQAIQVKEQNLISKGQNMSFDINRRKNKYDSNPTITKQSYLNPYFFLSSLKNLLSTSLTQHSNHIFRLLTLQNKQITILQTKLQSLTKNINYLRTETSYVIRKKQNKIKEYEQRELKNQLRIKEYQKEIQKLNEMIKRFDGEMGERKGREGRLMMEIQKINGEKDRISQQFQIYRNQNHNLRLFAKHPQQPSSPLNKKSTTPKIPLPSFIQQNISKKSQKPNFSLQQPQSQQQPSLLQQIQQQYSFFDDNNSTKNEEEKHYQSLYYKQQKSFENKYLSNQLNNQLLPITYRSDKVLGTNKKEYITSLNKDQYTFNNFQLENNNFNQKQTEKKPNYHQSSFSLKDTGTQKTIFKKKHPPQQPIISQYSQNKQNSTKNAINQHHTITKHTATNHNKRAISPVEEQSNDSNIYIQQQSSSLQNFSKSPFIPPLSIPRRHLNFQQQQQNRQKYQQRIYSQLQGPQLSQQNQQQQQSIVEEYHLRKLGSNVESNLYVHNQQFQKEKRMNTPQKVDSILSEEELRRHYDLSQEEEYLLEEIQKLRQYINNGKPGDHEVSGSENKNLSVNHHLPDINKYTINNNQQTLPSPSLQQRDYFISILRKLKKQLQTIKEQIYQSLIPCELCEYKDNIRHLVNSNIGEKREHERKNYKLSNNKQRSTK